MSNTPLQPDESGAQPVLVQTQTPKLGKALSRIKRELSEEELATPGLQKMLVADLERLEEEKNDLKVFREKFHAADKDLGITKEKLKSKISIEIISTGCIAVGAAALGYAPEMWKNSTHGWIALVFGSVLTVLGIVAKAVRL